MKKRYNYFKMGGVTLLTYSLFIAQSVHAQSVSSNAPTDTIYLPKVELLGKKDGRLFKRIPGAVYQVNAQELQKIMPLGTADVFRKIPGMHVNDEDPASLRFNVGLRGLYPQRSSRVLILEDGVPVTLNPYGEPALYFSPLIDQMEGIEVLKSSGQLLYGPQTIGGVINLITADPPTEAQTRIKLQGGDKGFFSGGIRHGNSVGNAGYLLSYNHKRADQLGTLGFDIHNASAKFSFHLNERSKLGARVGFYSEESNATYVGITQQMYEENNFVQQTIASNDLMLLDRYHASIHHEYRINAHIELQTLAYAYYIRRNWRRQNFDRTPVAGQTYERILGDPTATDGSSIFFRNNAQWRNRQYVVKGVEPRLRIDHRLLSVENKLQTGLRVLWETAYEQALHTPMANGFNGDSRNNEQRDGFAASFYAVNETRLNEKWTTTLGLRLEQYDMKRKMYPANATANEVTHQRSVTALIPGAGLTFAPIPSVVLFAGVHKGFAPPELKSAINASGQVDEIDKEESINYELGGRIDVSPFVKVSPTLFFLDFKNQQIPVLLSTAGSGFANGGKSQHKGGELALDVDLGRWIGSGFEWGLGSNFTYTDARFAKDEEKVEGDNIERVYNNYLPYAPKFMVNNSIYGQWNNGLGFSIAGNYVGKQYHDGLNTQTPSRDGTTGAIQERYIWEATASYTYKEKFTMRIAGKNLTNQKYITSRSPQGIRVGLERYITFGVDVQF
jgi:Fe(3+) dicitrate transport protein